MKKFLLILILIFSCILGLTACDRPQVQPSEEDKPSDEVTKPETEEKSEEEEHTCVFTGDWQYDGEYHWKVCECGLFGDDAKHSGGEATDTQKAVCEVCGAEYGEVSTPDDSTTEEGPTVDEPSEEVTQEDIDKIRFKNGSFAYTGEKFSLEVTNLPQGFTVSYDGNEKSEIGTYIVTATVKDSNGKVVKTLKATLEITNPEFDLTGVKFESKEFLCDGEEKELVVEGLPEGLKVEYTNNYQTLAGEYKVVATLKDKFDNVVADLEATLTIKTADFDLSGVKFESKTFSFTGDFRTLEVEGVIPEGLEVTYEGNGEVLIGEYTVTATFKDEYGNVIKTLEATLTIARDAEEEQKYPNLTSIGIDPDEVHNGYQLQVYSFWDSDGNGYGDINGVTEKLDYIEYLGADIIWLSPIMSAVSYHGYDITSFYTIDPKLGTMADYKNLVNEAHERGIKIVLDMPINHTSPEHEWFKGFIDGDPRYAEYYQERKAGVNYGSGGMGTFWTHEETGKTYFGAFGPGMPDLNFQSAELKQGIQNVFEFWLGMGADGFRLDAIKHIYDPNEIPSGQNATALNNQYWSELRSYLKGINENIYLVGENFSGQQEVKSYAKSFDAEFDFEGWHTALGAVANNGSPWSRSTEDCRIYYDDTIIGCTNELIGENPDWIPSFMTGNHDVTRAASFISDSGVTDLDQALKLYGAMTAFRAGIPYVYAGDEFGMYGKNYPGEITVKDGELRLPIPFRNTTVDVEEVLNTIMKDDAGNSVGVLGANIKERWPNFATTCTSDPTRPYVEDKMEYANSVLNVYANAFKLRRQYPALALGSMRSVADYNSCATIIAFDYNGETIYVAFNFAPSATTLNGVTNGSISLIHTVNGVSANGGNLQMSGRGVAVFTATGTMGSGNSTGGGSSLDLNGFSLRGDITNWELSNDYLFTYHDEDEVKITVTLTAGSKFKVVQENSATTAEGSWWHGDDQVKTDCKSLTSTTDNDKNIIIKDSGTYNLYWDVDDFQLWIEKVQ